MQHWENELKVLLEEYKIRELHLRFVPVLKNCDNWLNVKEVGFIDHRTKYAHYNGLVVEYGEKNYFLPMRKLDALKPYRSWNIKKSIQVIET